MSSPIRPAFAPLPKSHYFLTLSRGTGMRTFAVRVLVVQVLLCVLPLLALLGTASTAYILLHDDVVASLMNRQGEMQYAYEDRLDALRGELRRQAAQNTTDRLSLEVRLHDLVSREGKLEGRADLVASVADLTGLMPGRRPATRQAEGAGIDPAGPREGVSGGPAGLGPPKPHPVADQAPPGAARPAGLPDSLSALDPAEALPLSQTLSLAAASLDKVERVQLDTLVKIGAVAREEASRLGAMFAEVGLSSDRFRTHGAAGEGGPFVPLPADRDTPFGQAMLTLQDTLSTAARLRGAVTRVPLADPLPGPPDISSPFGARLDPFVGRPALHTGVDLREAYGTAVKATAAGRVSFAGTAGGYGNMVEVDHGDGLVTRYAHMEEVLVAEGQTLEKDTVVGRVGATGRATGPHLHYEIRVDNEPVDPMRYLAVGLRAVALLSN